MKIDYFKGGIDSLELSLEHLNKNTDRDLRAAILLGFHGIFSLFKAIARKNGITIIQGKKSIKFPLLVSTLKTRNWLSSVENKPLELLSRLRNALEHSEVEYDREKFKIALVGVLPIIERIIREYDNTDLQDLISDESWEILIDIKEFFDPRKKSLEKIVEKALNKPKGKNSLWDISEVVFCDICSQLGLPWKGKEKEEVKCKFCGGISLIASCEICNGPIIVSETDDWPYIHDSCWKSYMNQKD
jgi:hypothetical protein